LEQRGKEGLFGHFFSPSTRRELALGIGIERDGRPRYHNEYDDFYLVT
jgi:hypothetical protein